MVNNQESERIQREHEDIAIVLNRLTTQQCDADH
jgi:hypothetical protein